MSPVRCPRCAGRGGMSHNCDLCAPLYQGVIRELASAYLLAGSWPAWPAREGAKSGRLRTGVLALKAQVARAMGVL